jgi:ADP-L-glycero-D-manno-heptose 6-epimerase
LLVFYTISSELEAGDSIVLVVTGGCGMVGSNLVAALNARGYEDILVVDSLRNGDKFRNVADLRIADYLDRGAFMERLATGRLPKIDAIFHQGACTDTTERDGQLMMERNYRASRDILDFALGQRVPLIYASSAAVYGLSETCVELPGNEAPLNIYAYSKKLFDDHVRRAALGPEASPVVGLRYFNVYGPREGHKGKMSSVALRMVEQIRAGDRPTLFGAYGGLGPGQHRRDFVHVSDVVQVILWAWEAAARGVYNCGTGVSRSFLDLAAAVIAEMGAGEVQFQPFPEALHGRYQSHTEADLTRLRAAGCDWQFRDLETGIGEYVAWLRARGS